jgi:hypothetical protein
VQKAITGALEGLGAGKSAGDGARVSSPAAIGFVASGVKFGCLAIAPDIAAGGDTRAPFVPQAHP